MRSRLLIVTLTLSIAFASNSFAIENGLDATGSQYVVKVISTYSKGKVSSCSGGILSDYVVVTAAHCLDDESGLISKEIWVLPPGGVAKRDANGAYLQDATWIQVDNTQITTTFQNVSTNVEDDDLAFLVLKRPLVLGFNILIPSEDETNKLKSSNAALRLYGYGYISDSGKTSDAPNYYIGRFDSQRTVNVKNSGFASSTDATSCKGDSGGPVLSITATSVTVVGVITGGATSNVCGKKNTDGKYYTLFTLLSRYANLAFAAASSATKKAVESANAAQKVAEEKSQLADSNFRQARQDADSASAKSLAIQSELDKANTTISDLELKIQSLQNEIKILTAKLTLTINCVKGKTIKKITGIEPQCPAGFRKK